MYTRDKNFYDIVAKGLIALGYTGSRPLEAYINDMFANKYNADRTFTQVGFPLNPNIPINPTFTQIEATVRPYTMAGYVDIDSDGPTKSTDGMELKMGGLPTFKHEVVLSRKIIREQMMLANAIGETTPDMEMTIMDLLFNGLDDLLGGNYNTLLYQRHQIVSNFGKLVIDANNNPLGQPLLIDFAVPEKNLTTSIWYSKDSEGNVTQATDVTDGGIDPIKVMKQIRINSRDVDFAPVGHWECSRRTYEDLIALPYFRKMYVLSVRPDVTDATNIAALGNIVPDETIKAFIEGLIGARIDVIDSISAVERYNKETRAMEYTNLDSFNEGVLVYVPDGAIGDVQCGRPVYMETPGARVALYDGGRTLIRQVFNDETMTQVIKSEITGLVVPDKTRWFYYLTVKES